MGQGIPPFFGYVFVFGNAEHPCVNFIMWAKMDGGCNFCRGSVTLEFILQTVPERNAHLRITRIDSD